MGDELWRQANRSSSESSAAADEVTAFERSAERRRRRRERRMRGATGEGGSGGLEGVGDEELDYRMMSFQTQLQMAILESQRHIMLTGGYGRPEGSEDTSSQTTGVSDL